MSSFFERNKRKSLLALLLLLLQRGKGVVALLFMIFILSTLFVLPSGMHVPWASRPGERPAFPSSMGAVSAMFRAAREEPHDAWFSFGARPSTDNPGRSTVDYVQGALPTVVKEVKLPKAETVAGIARPEDGDRRDNAVQMDMGELVSGLVQSAEAGVMAGGGPAGEVGGGSDPGKLAAFTQGSAVPPGSTAVEAALGTTSVPPAGQLYQGHALHGGQLSRLGMYSLTRQFNAGSLKPPTMGDNFYLLAEARAYSVAAAPPTCPSPGCPKEFAHESAGIVFEGLPANLSIMDVQGFTETSAGVPDQAAINGMDSKAQEYSKDAQQCEANDRTIGVSERQDMAALGTLANQLNARGCAPESGSCDAQKAADCQKIADQMKALCHELNTLFQQKRAGCPLSAPDQFDQHGCDQT